MDSYAGLIWGTKKEKKKRVLGGSIELSKDIGESSAKISHQKSPVLSIMGLV